MEVYELTKSFLFNEIKRTLKSKITILMMILTVVSPLVFTFISQNYIFQAFLSITSGTLLTEIVILPSKIGAVFGVIFFVILTIYEFDKVSRFNVGNIIEPCISSVKFNVCKVVGLIFAAFISVMITVIFLPNLNP